MSADNAPRSRFSALVAAGGLLTLAAATQASFVTSPVKVIVERSGRVWDFDENHVVGLIGFHQVTRDTHVSAASLDDQIRAGEALAYWNGGHSGVDYWSGDHLQSNGVDPFAGLTIANDSSRQYGTVFVLFEKGTNVVFRNPTGGTSTLGSANIDGDFEFVVNSVPAPGGAAVLAAAGFMCAKRRRRL